MQTNFKEKEEKKKLKQPLLARFFES